MSTFKKISLTVNAETGAFIDPVDGSKLNTASLPDFCLGETSILCLSFVDSSLNAYPFETNDVFELAIDKDFVHTVSGAEDPLMAYSADSMFNISGDWDSASLAAGKISVRINCNTTGFVSKIGSSESVMAWVEIKRYPAGLTDASIILRNKCITRNSVKVTEGSPSEASPDYYTALQINTLMGTAEEAADAKYALQSNVLELDNITAFTPTADYHPATKKYVDDNAVGESSGSGTGANLLINGSFAVWQRGTTSSSISTTRTYLADRWAVKTGAGTLATVARSGTVPSESRSRYSLELTGATGVTAVTADQRIEAMNTPKEAVYFSAYIYNGSGAAFAPKLYVSTPSVSDNWTASSVINGSGAGELLLECADSAWTKVYWTADISAYSNISNGVEFKLEIPSGSLVSGDTVRIADAVLIYGSSYSTLAQEDISIITRKCRRYYRRSGNAPHGIGQFLNATLARVFLSYETMRTAPTLSYEGTPSFVYGGGGSLSVSSLSAQYMGGDGGYADFVCASGGTVGYATILSGTLVFNSEL